LGGKDGKGGDDCKFTIYYSEYIISITIVLFFLVFFPLLPNLWVGGPMIALRLRLEEASSMATAMMESKSEPELELELELELEPE
jgi:hypothetical protein